MPKKKRGEIFSIKQAYKDSFAFIKDSRNFIYSTILIFFIFCTIAFFFEELVNSFFRLAFGFDLRNFILRTIRVLIEQTKDLSYFGLMKFIFINNLQSSFYGLVFGIFFSIFPIISIMFNGYLLGFVGLMSIKAEGILILWKILPHGIFELPAIFISLGLGIRLGAYLFKKDKVPFRQIFISSIKTFVLVVIPLLIIAAVIETSLLFLTG
ncbi:stage II sporulation protein M [Candidatus Pacearchaeota archaeon]|nr:stage II sporulation protein M [Candidatus Pacearchaeota archaeon]